MVRRAGYVKHHLVELDPIYLVVLELALGLVLGLALGLALTSVDVLAIGSVGRL